jgi:choline kinase
MLEIIKHFVPADYSSNAKIMHYYLKTLKDSTFKRSIPSVSMYQVELTKNHNSITIVIHSNFSSTANTITFAKLKDTLERAFAPTPENTPFQFLIDLRF